MFSILQINIRLEMYAETYNYTVSSGFAQFQ